MRRTADEHGGPGQCAARAGCVLTVETGTEPSCSQPFPQHLEQVALFFKKAILKPCACREQGFLTYFLNKPVFYVSNLLLFLPIALSVWTLSRDPELPTAALARSDLPGHWPISPEARGTGGGGRDRLARFCVTRAETLIHT